MAATLSWERQQQRLQLVGDLDRETLLPLWQQQEALLAGITQVDVSQLDHVDSAGLALLVHWQAQQGAALAITGIGDKLSTLITLYNLQDVIPMVLEARISLKKQ